MNLDGRAAIITGASRGIGLAIANRLHEAGARVALCARSTSQLRENCERMGPERALAVEMDVRSESSVGLAIASVVERFGRIDIVVNNAGTSGITKMDSKESAPWLDIIQTNLIGSYFVTHAAMPHLQEHGRVINISSVLGKFGVPGYSAYCASKTAIIGFTRALALELAPKKITVNAICPGWVDTEMAWSGMRDIAVRIGVTTEEFRKQAMAQVPLGEMIEPKEVAELAFFLASDAGKNVTAQAISICGGSTQA